MSNTNQDIRRILVGFGLALSLAVLGLVAADPSFSSAQIQQGGGVGDPGLYYSRGVNKFGRSTNVDSGVATDIWDRANPTATVGQQPIWLAPTAARIHAIVSNSADDDGDPGAGSVRVYGLQTWDSLETSEDVTLNGTTPVNTVNSYVIIHRMVQLSGVGINVGYIKATAASDSTITAQINPGEGQTQMAIYGVSSLQTAYMTGFYGSVERDSPQGAEVTFKLLYSMDVTASTTLFVTKHTLGTDDASGPFHHPYDPYKGFTGPGIIKLQAASDSNDTFADAGFDLKLVGN